MTLNRIGSFDTNHKIKQLIDAIECQTTNGLETETIKDLYEYINTHFHLPNPIVEQMSDTFQVLVMDDEGYITYIDDQFCKKLVIKKKNCSNIIIEFFMLACINLIFIKRCGIRSEKERHGLEIFATKQNRVKSSGFGRISFQLLMIEGITQLIWCFAQTLVM